MMVLQELRAKALIADTRWDFASELPCAPFTSFTFVSADLTFICSYRNRWLTIYFVAVFVMNSVMLLLPSSGRSLPILKSEVLFQMNALDDVFKMMPLPDTFKWQLYFLLCFCSVGMVATEWLLFHMFQKENGRTHWHILVEKIRNYVWFPLLRAFSRGKFFKFRAVSDQGAEGHVEM